ncbi:acyltransferase family protein [Brevundimonas sp. AJA228-03]|uniref:acyltransferase family protein n=1 Tax=Brevundimonas sp. AJA228-03 TaxID=2752515 RepID=UPI001ADEF5FF|nr:acyltransferase family protein [Brevundimonas sp. AJA228-03]QTN19435.1 acyltransferase family protein [Brevundimonas sp. AJA228-03]
MTTEIHRPDRLHGLDALRAGALLLGVVLHASLAFFPQQIWIVADESRSIGAAGLFFAIHLFRMTAFFLIAGLFAHMMLARRGWPGFVRDRALRITGPLAAFWFPVMVGIVGALIWTSYVNGLVVPGASAPPPPTYDWTNFPLTHLWFLYVLTLFYAGVLILRAPFALLDRDGGWGRMVDRMTGALIGPWTPAVLAAPLALALYLDPKWIAFFAVPTPDAGLVPHTAALVGFGLAFGLGFLIDRRRDLLNRIAAWSPLFLVVAVVSGVAAWHLAGGPKITPMVELTDEKAIAAAVTALAVYSSALAAMGLCLRFLSGYSAIRRYLADASYWVYILHLPLVMLAQVWVQDWAGPWWLKLGGVSLGVFAVCLITYELLIRHSFMGRWLNGRRVPWRKSVPMTTVAAE